MSELIAHDLVDIQDYRGEVYLKSEADKVIAELKAQKAQAEDDCAYWKTMARKNAADNAEMAKQRAEALKRERHHKYKRCLAMSKLCHWKMGVFIYKNEKSDFYFRWHKRWRELAEKFKPNNSTAQHGKG